MSNQLTMPSHLPGTVVTDFCWSSVGIVEPAQGASSRQVGKAALAPDQSSGSPDPAPVQPSADPGCTNKFPSSEPSQGKGKEKSKGDTSEKSVHAPNVRTPFSVEQIAVLEKRFQKQSYLSPNQMRELCSLLNISYDRVKTWFQNRRMKVKARKGGVPCVDRNRWAWQRNSHLGIGSTMPPRFIPGYPIHAGGNVMGPMSNPHYSFTRLGNPHHMPAPVRLPLGGMWVGHPSPPTASLPHGSAGVHVKSRFVPELHGGGRQWMPSPLALPGPYWTGGPPLPPGEMETQSREPLSDYEDTEDLM